MADKPGGPRGSVPVIAGLLLAGYLAADMWAAGQLQPSAPAGGLGMVTGLRGNLTGGAAVFDASVQLRNPTLVPVAVPAVGYELTYGPDTLGEGETGFVFLMPRSEGEFQGEFRLNYSEVRGSVARGLVNLITGGDDDLQTTFYADFVLARRTIHSAG